MSTDQKTQTVDEEVFPWPEFLESVPPSQSRRVSGMVELQNTQEDVLAIPPLQLYCDSESCGGVRFFDSPQKPIWVSKEEFRHQLLNYHCRHCRGKSKAFSIYFRQSGECSADGIALKVGEYPPFGPPVPTKMFTLLGEDQETFHKGRRAESQGMGIGAFAYYRRVVENQKNRLIDQIIKVSKVLKAAPKIIADLEAARKETQFDKAVRIIKDGIPDVLRIEGHNPLTLLHNALSDGLHDRSDEECLARAAVIRTVMAELAERISEALKEQAEFKQAITKLLQIQSAKVKPAKPDTASQAPQPSPSQPQQ